MEYLKGEDNLPFVVDENGKARKVTCLKDINDIQKRNLRLIDDNGRTLIRKASKSTIRFKLFGE